MSSLASHQRVLTRSRLVAGLGVVALLAIMAASTTWWPAGKALPGERQEFDAAAWAEDNYESKIVPGITESAVELTTLVPLLREDPEAAGERYGKRDGSSPFTYAVTLTGTAQEPDRGLLPLQVEGLPDDVRVALQVGPAISGTALRDATGLVRFNDFVNQVEYSQVAIALNNKMKESVLADLDPEALVGKRLTLVGATAPPNSELIIITAVSIEVSP